MLTQKRVRELFDYQDGDLIRKVNIKGAGLKGSIVGVNKNYIYLDISIDNHKYQLTHIIWLWHYGYLPENLIDHIDKNPKNNNIKNLREIGKICNARNVGNWSTNTSGVKGVHFLKSENKWRAQIQINKKNYNIGYCSDFAEAVFHRLAAEQCVDWEDCDSCSPAYQYMKKYLRTQKWARRNQK